MRSAPNARANANATGTRRILYSFSVLEPRGGVDGHIVPAKFEVKRRIVARRRQHWHYANAITSRYTLANLNVDCAKSVEKKAITGSGVDDDPATMSEYDLAIDRSDDTSGAVCLNRKSFGYVAGLRPFPE